MILLLHISVEMARIPHGRQKPQIDVYDIFFYAGIVYGEAALFFASQMVREREVKALQDISQRHV